MNKALHLRYLIVYIGYALVMSTDTIEFFTFFIGLEAPFPTFSLMEWLGYNCATLAYYDFLVYADQFVKEDLVRLWVQEMKVGKGYAMFYPYDSCEINSFENTIKRVKRFAKWMESDRPMPV